MLFFRSDAGDWLNGARADVVTCAAVHAGDLRYKAQSEDPAMEERITQVMRERMARILFLFERKGVTHLVLGSFGTGVFKNNVEMVADTWKILLQGRFKGVFEEVVFAILGRPTFETFEAVFE